MTTVIGDEDNGWSSATMVNGELISQHKDNVQDIHQHATTTRLTPVGRAHPTFSGMLYHSEEQVIKGPLPIDNIGQFTFCGCASVGKTSITCEEHQKEIDSALCPHPKWASPVSRLEEEKSMLKELNKPQPICYQILTHVEGHIILDILKKQPLTLSQLIGCSQLSNVSTKAVESAVETLISQGKITLGCDSTLRCVDPQSQLNESSDLLFPSPDWVKKSPTSTSPKSLDSSHKIPVNLCPASAIIAIAMVISLGHKKPGRSIYNWRTQPISYSEYLAAAQRHMLKSNDGSDYDPELTKLAGVNIRHDWAAMSCLAIIEDARQAGTLVDDRPVKGGAEEFLESLMVKK